MENNFIPERREETILIILDTDSYNPSTIQRGSILAKAFGGSFHIWFAISAAEVKDNKDELEFVLTESKKMGMYFGAKSFIMSSYRTEKNFRAAFKAIKEELSITQMVLTGSIESRWEEILYGSTVNYMLNKYPDIELHFISQSLTFPYENWDYERGKKAFLIEDQDELFLSYQDEKGIKGIFFKEKATDFESGIFLAKKANDIRVYNIIGGNVTSQHYEIFKVLEQK